jgi:hypothetical protein
MVSVLDSGNSFAAGSLDTTLMGTSFGIAP